MTGRLAWLVVVFASISIALTVVLVVEAAVGLSVFVVVVDAFLAPPDSLSLKLPELRLRFAI